MGAPIDAPKFSLQGLLVHVDSAKANDRILALDILGQCLQDISKVNISILPDSFKKNSLKAPITFAILTRCEDVSSSVRTKALIVLSQKMKYVLHFFEETRNIRTFETEGIDMTDECLDVNGSHRFFWYHLRSAKERRRELEAMVKRLMDDDCPTTRKTAILVFQNLLIFHPNGMKKKNLKHLVSASNARHIIVRKQAIQSVSNLLEVFSENFVIREIWLECILPLIYVSETSIEAKALLILEAEFLVNIFSPLLNKKKRSLELLRVLCSGDFLAYQNCFKRAFKIWESEEKLKSGMGSNLIQYIGTESEESVWFYFSCLAPYCILPPIASEVWIERFTSFLCLGDKVLCVENMLTVAEWMAQNWPSEALENISSILAVNLKSFAIPVDLISKCIETLFKVHRCKGTLPDFEQFSSEVTQLCEKMLSDFQSERAIDESASEEELAKCFRTLTDLSMCFPTDVPHNTVSFLRTFFSCRQMPTVSSFTVKAHALVALGKLCLRDEDLAKDLFPLFTKEYFLSEDDAIRNNSAIILIDLCKRYSSLSSKLMPLMIAFFKDRHYLIRYQTIVLLVRLLHEGYIRWEGSMFYCLLSTLIDRSKAIQEIGQHSLSLLSQEKKHIFTEHFIESIFLLNNFPPPDNMAAAQKVKHLQIFALPGENGRQKRMILYRFLLEFTDIKKKISLIESICDILKNVAESVYPLNEKTECIIRDCFSILTCSEIRIVNVDEFENAEEGIEKDVRRAELEIRRGVNVDPVVPAVISLKNSIKDPQSDLMQDIILFLKDLLHDFTDNQNDILAEDRILLGQLELEMKNDVERERRNKTMRKKLQEESIQAETNAINNEKNYTFITHTQKPVVTILQNQAATVSQNQGEIVSQNQVGVSQNLVETVDFNVCSLLVENDEKCKLQIEIKNDDGRLRKKRKTMSKELQKVNTPTETDSVDNKINWPVIFPQNAVLTVDTNGWSSQIENKVRKRKPQKGMEQSRRRSQRLFEKLERKM